MSSFIKLHHITKYANTLQTLCEELSSSKDRFDRETVLTELIKSIIKLMDKNKRNDKIHAQCIDMWDKIYKFCYNMQFSHIFDNMD